MRFMIDLYEKLHIFYNDKQIEVSIQSLLFNFQFLLQNIRLSTSKKFNILWRLYYQALLIYPVESYSNQYFQVDYGTFLNKIRFGSIIKIFSCKMYSWKMNSFSNYSLPKSQINFNSQFYGSSSQENCPKPQFYLINFPLPLSCYNYFSPTNQDEYQVNQPAVTNQAGIFKEQACQQDKNLLLPQNKLDKKNGNVKANIVRDFIRSIKKDASAVLLAKNTIRSQFSIKKFMEILLNNFPNQNKYLRFKKIQELCSIKEEPQFSKLLRIVFAHFMRLNYKCLVLAKKKNKLEYLRACRQMMENLSEVIN